MSRSIVSIGLATGLAFSALGLAGGAHAQNTPPAWDTLVRCAQIANEGDRLACYDTAMRAAGYAPNPTAVAEDQRKHFGLSLPRVSVPKRHKKEESQVAGAAPQSNPNEIEITVDQVAITQPVGKLVIFSTEGQIWEQTDTTQVNNLPKEGDSVSIHKEALGGFFCDVNKYQSVRCKRMK